MVSRINRTSRVRLAFEALECRDLFAGDFDRAVSSVWLLASAARDRDNSAPYAETSTAALDAQLQASAPSTTGLLGGGLVNQPPAGADATINLLDNLPYTFGAADFGFSDADAYSLSPTQTTDGPAAGNVLVFYNTASAAGIEIANYYAQIHPGVHLLGINGIDPSNEDISADDYLSTIRPQVMAALTPSIDVIVTTKGLPLRIQVTEPALPLGSTYVDGQGSIRTVYSWKPFSSLESELARVNLISNWQSMGDQGNNANPLWLNSYYQSNASFSYASFGTRLTARLDGYTVADVEAAIDRAQLALIGPQNHPNGPFYFLVDNDPSKSYSVYMANLVNQVLIPDGMPMVYDNTSAFVGTAPGPVIGYDSHGVHQASTPANYLLTGLNATLADGAVFQSWESYNAYSFTTSNPHGNQGQVAQWLQIGGTVGVGNVEEPTASTSTLTNENQMYKMLIAGRTFAEAAWSGTRQLSWVNTVVGDPLMRWRALVPGANSLAAVKISTLPTSGTLTNSGVAVTAGQFISVADINAGLLKFTPASAGTSFTFQVQDTGIATSGGGNLDLSPNTITIGVTAVNDAPSGTDKTVTAMEDTPYTFTTANFGFSDSGDSPVNSFLAAKITTLPAAGTLTNGGAAVTAGQSVSAADIAAGLFKFTPDANAKGTSYTSFTFQVQDNGGTAGGGVDLDPTPNTITINVTSVNDAPSGTDKTVTALEDTAYTFTAADFGFSDSSDSPANTLTAVKISTSPTAGTLTNNGAVMTAGQSVTLANINGGKLKFTPAAGVNGLGYSNFTFQVQDNGGTANGGVDLDPTPHAISIDVTAVNDAPAGTDKTVTVLKDTVYTFTVADLGFTDPNDASANNLLSVQITTLPTKGSLTDNGVAVTVNQFIPVADILAGLLKYAPEAGANVSSYANFKFKVQDDGGTANGGVNLDATPNTITVDVTPVADSPPVGFWRFDGGAGGTVGDVSDNGNMATLMSGVALGTGHSGGGLLLSGANQRAVVADAPSLDMTGAITISAWIAPSKLATQTIVKKARTGAIDGYELSLSSSGKVFVRFNQDTSGDKYRLDSTTKYPTNGSTWLHVAATYDGSTMRLYVNGQLQASKAATFAIHTNNTAAGIGAEDGGKYSMRGRIDDVLLADRALSAAEIGSLYQGNLPPGWAATKAPTVSAGLDVTTRISNAATLAGSVADDGQPTGASLTTQWSLVSGPGSVSFGNSSAAATTATFSALGDYVLRLTASDGTLGASDDVLVKVVADSTGIAGHWRLDESSGTTTADASGNDNQATLTAGATLGAGHSGNGLLLTGSNQRAVVADAPSLDMTGAITISAWIPPASTATQAIVKKARTGSIDGYELSLSSSGKVFVRFNQYTSGDQYRLDSTSSYPTSGSTWLHVAATYDGSTIRLYVNGQLQASKAATFAIHTNNTALGIGAEDGGKYSMRGRIDDVLLADRALSAAEISDLYQGA